MKVNLPEEFGKSVRKYLDSKGLSLDSGSFIFDKNTVFLEEELDSIRELNFRHADIRYLQYFRNLTTLVIDYFPSITDDDLKAIISNCPNLMTLAIKNQTELKTVDVTKLKKLRCLSLVSNRNLVSLKGIESLEDFDNFEFYDNGAFRNVEYLIRNVLRPGRDFSKINLDLLYYHDMIKYLKTLDDLVAEDVLDYVESNVRWSECYGFREPKSKYYSTGEVQSAYEYAMELANGVVDRTLSLEENFVRLYIWLVDNMEIPYVTINKSTNSLDGTCPGIQRHQTTPSFAPRIMQFMLRGLDIDAQVVNVYTPVEEVKKIGAVASDYSVLRTNFGYNSFSDLSLDILVREFTQQKPYDNLFIDYKTLSSTNKVIHCPVFDSSKSMSKKRKEELVKAAKADRTDMGFDLEKKRKSLAGDVLFSKINVEVAKEEIRTYYNLMSSNAITLNDYLNLKRGLADAKRRYEKYSLIGAETSTMFDNYSRVNVFDSKSFIERTLGIVIDVFDKSGIAVNGQYPLKSSSRLNNEKEQLIRHVNREEHYGVLDKALANKLRSKIEYVYGFYLKSAPIDDYGFDDYVRIFTDQLGMMVESDALTRLF